MPDRNTLGRTERLKSRRQIEDLFANGHRFMAGPYRVFWLPGTEPGVLRFGVGAGTRHFKKAVDRNRIKRLTRELWRCQNGSLKTWLSENKHSVSVFLIFTGKLIPGHAELLPVMQKLVTKLENNIRQTA